MDPFPCPHRCNHKSLPRQPCSACLSEPKCVQFVMSSLSAVRHHHKAPKPIKKKTKLSESSQLSFLHYLRDVYRCNTGSMPEEMFGFGYSEVKLCFAEEGRAAGLKTDINKCKQLWPWDVIKKNSMSRPHKTITYCYFQAAGVIARRH